jgi:hypothetical protein
VFNIEEIVRQRCREKLIRVLAVALIGFGLGACCFPFSEGVKVDVTNEGSGPLSDLKISFKGGDRTLSKLGVGSTHEFIVKPTGESDITLSFSDASGSARSHKVDVYIEPSCQGRIDIKVDRLANVTWKDDITLCPY